MPGLGTFVLRAHAHSWRLVGGALRQCARMCELAGKRRRGRMAAAAAASDSVAGGGLAAVRLPRSPPFKVLAEQLRRDAEGGPGSWRLSRAAAGREPLELAAVWMQGTVVAAGGGKARLRDPSGAFSVCGLERVPRGRPCLAPGNPGVELRADPRFVQPEGGAWSFCLRAFASAYPWLQDPFFLSQPPVECHLMISVTCSRI